MYEKRCNRCKRYSYSSDYYGMWNCPYCNKDLSSIRATVPKLHIRLISEEKHNPLEKSDQKDESDHTSV